MSAPLAQPWTGSAELPSAVASTLKRLERLRPLEAARARQALHHLLLPLEHSTWPEVAWSFSRLTNTGFPLEFAWTSQGHAIRYTLEAAGPELPEHARLAYALGVLRELGHELGVDHARWSHIQTGQRLQFGAWIGGRHGSAGDSYKLYIEVPDGSRIGGTLPRDVRCALAHPDLVWRMLGVQCDGSGQEFYGRIRALSVDQLCRFEARLFPGSRALLDAFASFTGQPTGAPALLRKSGISVSLDGTGTPKALCVFFFASALSESDRQVRARILRWTARYGVEPDLYCALIGDKLQDPRRRHGILGLGIDGGGSVWLQAGIRPA